MPDHSPLSGRDGDQHRDVQAVADPVDGLAEEQVADQAVAVRADDQQVDRVASELRDEPAGRIGAVEQDRTRPCDPVPSSTSTTVAR